MGSELIRGMLLACCGLNLALAAALWITATDVRSGKRLALALAVLAGMTVVYPLGWTGRDEVPPAIAFFPLNLPIALGPLLHAYVTILTTGSSPRREPLHFLPAGLLCAYLLVSLCLPADLRAEWKDTVHDKSIKPVIEGAVLLSLTGYSVASLRVLRRYRDFLSQARSDADRFQAVWVGRVFVGLTITLSLLTAVRIYTWNIGELDGSLLALWLGIFSTYLGVEGWRQSDRTFPQIKRAEETDGQTRDWRGLGEAWRAQTQDAEWWRKDDLTLADLAKRLGTNTAYLSRAINEGLGMNFNEMVNRMRALEVARQIDAGTAGDFTRAALDAGFNSKATFNRAFRATCGMSPSAWRSRLKS